jgi:hypothetical protein
VLSCIVQVRLQGLALIWIRIFSIHPERLSNSDWQDMVTGMAIESMLDRHASKTFKLKHESFGPKYDIGMKSDKFPWEFMTIDYSILACALYGLFWMVAAVHILIDRQAFQNILDCVMIQSYWDTDESPWRLNWVPYGILISLPLNCNLRVIFVKASLIYIFFSSCLLRIFAPILQDGLLLK